MSKPQAISTSATRQPRLKLVGVGFVFVWFFVGGIAHFALTDVEVRIVPPYIPWPRMAVLVSGVFELLGAAGLLWRPTRRLAGWALCALTVAVTPAHVYMLQQPELFNVPYWALVARVPLQVALLALIVWSTRPQALVLHAVSANEQRNQNDDRNWDTEKKQEHRTHGSLLDAVKKELK